MKKHEDKLKAVSKRNKRIITVTTLVGLVCPATLGTIQAMADEVPTATTEQPATPVNEQPPSETQPTVESQSQEPVTPEQPVTETPSQEPTTSTEPVTEQPALKEEPTVAPTETTSETQTSETQATTGKEATEDVKAQATEDEANKIEAQKSFDVEEASFSSYLSQIKVILDEVEGKIITNPHRVKHDDLITCWHIASSAGNDTPSSSRNQAFYDQWLAELQSLLNESSQLKADVDASQTAEIYTYYVVQNVVDDNGNIVKTYRWPETAVKDSTIVVKAVNWYGYYLLPGTPNKYSSQISQNETQEFVFTYMSVTSEKHRDPAKEKQISDLFTEIGDLHWELKLKSDGTQYAEPLQELWYRMDIVSSSVGMFMQSHGYPAWYEYALSNLPAILADMKALAVEINAIQPEESFTAGELDLDNARKIMAQYDSLDPYDYTEESWNKMIELDSQGEIYGASGSLRMLCDYPDSQIIKGSKDKIQQNVYAWTDRLTEAMKVLVKVNGGGNTLQESKDKLEQSTKTAEDQLTKSGYTASSMKALRSVLQIAKDVLANPNSTQAQIEKALADLETAMANLVKENTNSNQGGTNNGSNAGNSGANGNQSNGNNANGTNSGSNGATNQNNDNKTGNGSGTTTNQKTVSKTVNNQTNSNASNSSKEYPQTGEDINTSALLAGLSLVGFTTIGLLKRRRKA